MKKTSVITSLIAALCLVFQASAFAQSTNPIIYPYSTNLSIPSNGAPVLQYTFLDYYHGIGQILVNCYSNEICDLQETTNLATGGWTDVQPIMNGGFYTFYTTNSAELFFRLRVQQNRFYATLLPAPDGSAPLAAIIVPEWGIRNSYYFMVTNTSLANLSFSFCILSNEIVIPVYHDSLTNCTSEWQCGYLTEYYYDAYGNVQSAVAELPMYPGYHYTVFEANCLFNIPGLDKKMEDPCYALFPSLYIGTFGCSGGANGNANLGNGGGGGGSSGPITASPITGPVYSPPQLDPDPQSSQNYGNTVGSPNPNGPLPDYSPAWNNPVPNANSPVHCPIDQFFNSLSPVVGNPPLWPKPGSPNDF